MSHAKSFLADILEHPDDDTPRLVCADWLEDHGTTEADRARAEFIRIQCERARLPWHDPRWLSLRRREQELLREHQEAWRQPLPKWARDRGAFRRGFFARLPATFAEYLRGGPGLLRRAPVEDLHLRSVAAGDRSRLLQLLDTSLLAPLRGLSLDNSLALAPESVRALCASPRLANLRRLRLTFGSDPEASASLLASSPHLAGLTDLTVAGLGRQLAPTPRTLAGSPHLRNLEHLTLTHGQLTDPESVASSLPLGRLKTLVLDHQRIKANVAAALAAALSPGRLTELCLPYNWLLRDAGAAALAASPNLAGLTSLRLDHCGLGPAGARALARSPHLRELRYLNLAANSLADEGALALAESPHLGNLLLLDLRFAPLKTETIEALAASPRLPNLALLVVNHKRREGTGWVRLRERSGDRLWGSQELTRHYHDTMAAPAPTVSPADLPSLWI